MQFLFSSFMKQATGDILGTGGKKLRLGQTSTYFCSVVGEVSFDFSLYTIYDVLYFILSCFWNRLLLKAISSFLWFNFYSKQNLTSRRRLHGLSQMLPLEDLPSRFGVPFVSIPVHAQGLVFSFSSFPLFLFHFPSHFMSNYSLTNNVRTIRSLKDYLVRLSQCFAILFQNNTFGKNGEYQMLFRSYFSSQQLSRPVLVNNSYGKQFQSEKYYCCIS